jgi:hypothetical protein
MKLVSILRGEISPGFTIVVVIFLSPLWISTIALDGRSFAQAEGVSETHVLQPSSGNGRGADSKMRLSYHTPPAPSTRMWL